MYFNHYWLFKLLKERVAIKNNNWQKCVEHRLLLYCKADKLIIQWLSFLFTQTVILFFSCDLLFVFVFVLMQSIFVMFLFTFQRKLENVLITNSKINLTVFLTDTHNPFCRKKLLQYIIDHKITNSLYLYIFKCHDNHTCQFITLYFYYKNIHLDISRRS